MCWLWRSPAGLAVLAQVRLCPPPRSAWLQQDCCAACPRPAPRRPPVPLPEWSVRGFARGAEEAPPDDLRLAVLQLWRHRGGGEGGQEGRHKAFQGSRQAQASCALLRAEGLCREASAAETGKHVGGVTGLWPCVERGAETGRDCCVGPPRTAASGLGGPNSGLSWPRGPAVLREQIRAAPHVPLPRAEPPPPPSVVGKQCRCAGRPPPARVRAACPSHAGMRTAPGTLAEQAAPWTAGELSAKHSRPRGKGSSADCRPEAPERPLPTGPWRACGSSAASFCPNGASLQVLLLRLLSARQSLQAHWEEDGRGGSNGHKPTLHIYWWGQRVAAPPLPVRGEAVGTSECSPKHGARAPLSGSCKAFAPRTADVWRPRAGMPGHLGSFCLAPNRKDWHRGSFSGEGTPYLRLHDQEAVLSPPTHVECQRGVGGLPVESLSRLELELCCLVCCLPLRSGGTT